MRVTVSFPDEEDVDFDWEVVPRRGDFLHFEPPDAHAGDYQVAAVTFYADGSDLTAVVTLSDDPGDDYPPDDEGGDED